MTDAGKNRIICAIDTNNLDDAVALADSLKGTVGALKLGLEFFTSHGSEGVRKVANLGMPVFLDLKFHDIPNTVAGAIRSAIENMDIFMMTVHTSGGSAMMKSAITIAEETSWELGKKRPLIVGVTSLTSMDSQDLQDIGIITPITDHILRLAQLAKNSGLDGVVCPSFEIEYIRKQCGDNFKLVVPGIRPEGSKTDDQKRFTTPKEAIDLGADYIVIGRPITTAEDPVASAQQICQDLAA